MVEKSKGNNEYASSCGKWSLMNRLLHKRDGSPTAEAMDLKSIECGFESHPSYQSFGMEKYREKAYDMARNSTILLLVSIKYSVAATAFVADPGV